MARQRFVKPSFFTHHGLYMAEQRTGLPLRLAYEGLWGQADRRGVFQWKPIEIKLQVLPYDDVDFEAILWALADEGFVLCYEVAGKRYGHIPTLPDHQTFHKNERASNDPGPEKGTALHRPKPVPAPPWDGASTVLTPSSPKVIPPQVVSGSDGLSTVPTPPQHRASTPTTTTTTGTTTSTDIGAPVNWVAAITAELMQVGKCEHPQVGKMLKGLHATHGDLLVKAAAAYRKAKLDEGINGAKYARANVVHDFAQRAGVYVDHVRPGGALALVEAER